MNVHWHKPQAPLVPAPKNCTFTSLQPRHQRAHTNAAGREPKFCSQAFARITLCFGAEFLALPSQSTQIFFRNKCHFYCRREELGLTHTRAGDRLTFLHRRRPHNQEEKDFDDCTVFSLQHYDATTATGEANTFLTFSQTLPIYFRANRVSP